MGENALRKSTKVIDTMTQSRECSMFRYHRTGQKRGEERKARNPAFDHVADIKRLVVADTMHYIIGMPVHKQRRLTMNEAEGPVPRPLSSPTSTRVPIARACVRMCVRV